MESDKRFLLALGLTLAFLFVWFEYFVPKPLPQKAPTSVPSEQVSTPAVTSTPQTVEKMELKPEISQPLAPIRTFQKDTSLLSMEWTNRGGTVENITLYQYFESLDKNSENVKGIPFQGEAAPLSLHWQFDVNGESWSDKDWIYSVSLNEENSITFQKNIQNQFEIEKRFIWEHDTYVIQEEVILRNVSESSLKVSVQTHLYSGETKKEGGSFLTMGARKQPVRATAFVNDKAHRWTFNDIAEKDAVPTGDIQWAGFDAQYFLLTLLPTEGRWNKLKLDILEDGTSSDSNRQAEILLSYPTWEVSPGDTQRYALTIYVGPKDIGLLTSVGSSLDRAIDLGDWIGPIARPILHFLRWLHTIIANYGVAIILLTILVRLLMFPLTQMQARSMKKMQQHKPQMDALKKKHGDNKEAYSRELMTYMRTHRINPMGGCLLLLPQLPIFFALYRVLYTSIELRHAPFMFWIKDLSAHDPYFVMPVALGISMFIQQKLTPTPTADPAQQTMMKIMPVMFSVFMLFLPAGLNLYIFVSTLWGIAQQYWVQRDLHSIMASKEKVSRK